MMIEPRVLAPGEKITENGVYALTMEQHHGQPCDGPSVTSSVLRAPFKKSWRHYYMNSALNPNRVEFVPTAPMVLGTAGHFLFVGERQFKKYFVLKPDTYTDAKTGEEKKWNGNANVCREWLAEQAAKGLTVISGEQIEALKGMAAAVSENEMASSLLKGSLELTLAFKCEETGLWCLSRPDSIPAGANGGADLKCVADITDAGVARAMREQFYHQQAALCGEAFKEIFGVEMDSFEFVFVEYQAPYCVRIETVDPDDLALGHRQNLLARRMFRKCLDTGVWPGPANRYGDGGFFRFSEGARNHLEYLCTRMEEDLLAT